MARQSRLNPILSNKIMVRGVGISFTGRMATGGAIRQSDLWYSMSEVLPDDSLRFALYDAMRGVRMPTLKRALTEDERNVLTDAVFVSIKRAG